MKAYVTKYCLTGPIVETEIMERDEGSPYAYVAWPNGLNGRMQVKDSEWAEDEEGARIQAERRRKRKLESLKKSIRKLEDREFAVKRVND